MEWLILIKDFFVTIFNVALYQPLFNALVLLYEYLPGHDFGIAVIALTVLTRIIFYPLGVQAIKSQKVLQELQPKIQEIQRKYKDNKEKLARETMELYRRGKINPLSGCLPLLVQLPIIIALYQVFWKGLQPEQLSLTLYSFVPQIESINPSFLGMVDLAQSALIRAEGQPLQFLLPNIVLVLLAGIAQFFQTKMATPKTSKISSTKKGTPDFSQLMQKQMLYFFPIFTVFILLSFPSAIALYWLITSVFAILQQHLIFRKIK